MTTIVKQAMVNPTWQELEANQIELTEDQFSLIFAYSQKGAAALKAFRSLTGSVDTNADGTGVESASK